MGAAENAWICLTLSFVECVHGHDVTFSLLKSLVTSHVASIPQKTQNRLGSLKNMKRSQITQYSLAFTPKITKIFNKVQEISQFEVPGHNLCIIYRDLGGNLAIRTHCYNDQLGCFLFLGTN